jgi:hypothetical protein
MEIASEICDGGRDTRGAGLGHVSLSAHFYMYQLLMMAMGFADAQDIGP